VVARDNPHRLLGVIRRNDIVRAHEIGAMRRDEARRRAETLQSVKDSSAQFVDVLLVPGSHSVGKAIAALRLPREAVLISIRRGQNLVIPHGDTVLQVGDVVTALCERACVGNVLDVLNRLGGEKAKEPEDPEEPREPKEPEVG
jgi:Trk K+ transport system NAD-binding subunit